MFPFLLPSRMGIHGESGKEKVEMEEGDKIADRMIDALLASSYASAFGVSPFFFFFFFFFFLFFSFFFLFRIFYLPPIQQNRKEIKLC